MQLPSTVDEEPTAKLSFGIVAAGLGTIAAVIALITVWPSPALISEVRIRNASNTQSHELVVNGTAYGSVAAGELSQYKTMESAYPVPSVRLRANGVVYALAPEDHVGEMLLGEGRFTYTLWLSGTEGAPHIAFSSNED